MKTNKNRKPLTVYPYKDTYRRRDDKVLPMARNRRKNAHIGSSFDRWRGTELREKKVKKLIDGYKARLDLGKRLKRIAKKRGLSVRKLATMMNTSTSQVQRMFSSRASSCTVETLIKFSIVTGYELRDLFKKKAG